MVPVLICAGLLGGCTDEELSNLGFERYFVKLDKDGGEVAESVNTLVGDLGFEPIHIYDSATQGFAVMLHDGWATELRKHPDVKSVQKDENTKHTPPPDVTKPPTDDEVINDPEIVLGPNEMPESIARIGGPWLEVQDWTGTEVAVIDTGVDDGHPDLNVTANFDAVAAGGGSPDSGDPNGHGTHVAGTIGAIADGEGVVGMAPGVPIHAVRVLDADGSGWTTDIVAGLEYVLEHPEIRVVNMSLGGPVWDGDDPMYDAIVALEEAGVVVVVAAGNEAQDTINVAPASYDVGITVSAYDADGSDNGFAWFSNYGDAVDIAAPGTNILSTWPGGGWAQLDGTSMATPAVVGAVAVYRALNPTAGVDEIRSALSTTGENSYSGQGGDHPEPMTDAIAFWDAALQ
jgi:subtilisin family serine protease